MSQAKSPNFRKQSLLLALALLALACAGGVIYALSRRHITPQDTSSRPWFAPYIDVTETPTYAFDTLGATAHRGGVLSFIVASPLNPCAPSWGGYYSLDGADRELQLNARIARLRKQGGEVAIAFGGAAGSELALTCRDHDTLVAAYQSVIDHYAIGTVDLDLEGDSLTDTAARERRASAFAELQTAAQRAGRHLSVWLTLPVTPTGLTDAELGTVTAFLRHSVDIAGINIMTMEYGDSRPSSQSMLDAAKSALDHTKAQIVTLYQQAGIPLTPDAAWMKISATPQIGQASTSDELFTLDDAKQLNAYARSRGVGRISMWSANRDKPCDHDGAPLNTCSGLSQQASAFSQLLGDGFVGKIPSRAPTEQDR